MQTDYQLTGNWHILEYFLYETITPRGLPHLLTVDRHTIGSIPAAQSHPG
ncbi:hypothetical protein NDA01_30280 [Trichocoleus desertorum AS-A10]